MAANGGRRAPMPGFVLLVRGRADGDPAMRVGFTVTKKIGNAVVRNRMKRRLRALARELLPEGGVPGADHVLIGRAGGIERNFSSLRSELGKALTRLNHTAQPELVEGLPFVPRRRGKAGLRQAQPKRESGAGSK